VVAMWIIVFDQQKFCYTESLRLLQKLITDSVQTISVTTSHSGQLSLAVPP